MSAHASTSVPASSLEQPETTAAASATRTSAPYGQACVNCAKAKCKCILISQPSPGRGGSTRPTCERCARLGRECKPSSSIRKRGAAVSKRGAAGGGSGSASAGVAGAMSAASRAANLEQKLEDLVAILKAQASSQSNGNGGDESAARTETNGVVLPAATAAAAAASLSTVADRHSNGAATNKVVPVGPTVVTPASTAYATCSTANSTPSPAPAHDLHTSAAEAEETLVFFREHHLRFFPFIYLPPDMTAAQLRRDRPYLWLNISAVCCKSPTKQAVLSRQIREQLAQKILVSCERNIDMLLGALCLLGWTMHLCFKPTMSAVMSMATSIVSDLRLDKPAQEDDPRIINCFKSPDFIRIPHSPVRTTEERRATLACYVFCSSGGAFLRGPSMRWTSHMEESLKILSSNSEWEGDQILVLMVRIRQLADNIIQSQATWTPDHEPYGTLKPPISIYVKYYHQCLQTIKDQLPESLKDNRLATSLILSAEMVVSEIPFSNSTCWGHLPESHLDAHTRQLKAVPPPRHIDLARVEANYATLQTSKAFFEHFLTFELPDFIGFSFPVLLNFFRASQILYRLRVVDGISSDNSGGVVVTTATTTNTTGTATTNNGGSAGSLGLLGGIELVASRYEQLPGLYGFLTEVDAEGNEVNNFYTKCTKTFHSTLPMWRAHFAQAEASKMGTTTTTNNNNNNNTGGVDTGAGASAGAGLRADASASSAVSGPQVSPAVPMNNNNNNDFNANLGASRVNYSGMTNYMLPDLFSMDFSMDDAWCSEIMFSFDPTVLGPIQ
ncbi:hypothetical protein F4859DRAFT_508976 [Xylaria cf. heliscus]|nr:hypothetical protein F4859DRAFT_508976 [Xylaria cf. heliscus]